MMNNKAHLFKNLSLIGLSIFLAVWLEASGLLPAALAAIKSYGYLASFFAGMFFVSVFTVAPSATALVELSGIMNPFTVALFGGLGALVGDYLIFRFVKDSLSDDLLYLAEKIKAGRLFSVSKLRLVGWLVPFLGALVIASPLPDEVGIAMMGLSRVRNSVFIPLSFALNSFGILIILLLAQSL